MHHHVWLGGEGAVVGGASNSDQIADISGTQKMSSTAPVTMATMMMGGREEMVTTPNGSTPPTNDSYVMNSSSSQHGGLQYAY